MSDEGVVAALMEWWFRAPVADVETTEEAAALDDVKSLLGHLAERGYEVVRRG